MASTPPKECVTDRRRIPNDPAPADEEWAESGEYRDAISPATKTAYWYWVVQHLSTTHRITPEA
ncbi:MAG TPA: hypothetical protein VHJ17_23085 [Thermomonospora sp.]|nr:hypothetical protein [Thermomonospora sp.]